MVLSKPADFFVFSWSACWLPAAWGWARFRVMSTTGTQARENRPATMILRTFEQTQILTFVLFISVLLLF
jgi:uncharacterized membrane protein